MTPQQPTAGPPYRRASGAGTPREWARRHPRAVDAGVVLTIGVVVTLMIHEAVEFGTRPTDAFAYVLGVLMTLPLLVHRRRPLTAMVLCSVVLVAYYQADYPGISPVTVLAVPLYTAVLAGRMAWAVGIVGALFGAGYVSVGLLAAFRPLETLALFLTHAVLAAVVVLLAEVVRSRRALAEETRERLRLARVEREREAARQVAEERVRLARELHDTVAHSMATITVQAGSALHVLDGRDGRDGRDGDPRTALTAIRGASKEALRELRATLGVLRGGAQPEGTTGLDRLPTLLDAVRAAGVPVELEVAGRARPLAPAVDHSAYRILQESLTNVLQHGGPEVRAAVRLGYGPAGLTIEVADDGAGPVAAEAVAAGAAAGAAAGGAGGAGHGLAGMRERAEAAGGTFRAAPRPGGGFAVTARLPAEAP